MRIEEIKEFFSKKPEIIYPAEVIESSKMISNGKVFPITTSINGHIIPGLFITCNSEICNYFNIGYPPPTPNLKFRMVNLRQESFAIEVLLHFDNAKVMRLHLDPGNKLTKHYLKTGLRNMIVSFHFYNQDNHELIDSITNLDEEEIEWFGRNSQLSKKLKSNKKYKTISKMIKEKLPESNSEKLFEFHSTLNQNMLIEKSDKFFKMGEVKYHYEKPK